MRQAAYRSPGILSENIEATVFFKAHRESVTEEI